MPTTENRIAFASIKPETYYCWKQAVRDEDGNTRLLIPLSDGQRYEYPMDGIFKTPDEAVEYLKDFGNDALGLDLVLVKEEIAPLEIVRIEEVTEEVTRNLPDAELMILA